jgi:hypothetical protein
MLLKKTTGPRDATGDPAVHSPGALTPQQEFASKTCKNNACDKN